MVIDQYKKLERKTAEILKLSQEQEAALTQMRHQNDLLMKKLQTNSQIVQRLGISRKSL